MKKDSYPLRSGNALRLKNSLYLFQRKDRKDRREKNTFVSFV